jgi:monovalent cation:H+ antiporter, CPA1 family
MAVATIELVLTVFLVVMLISQIFAVKTRLPYTVILVFVGVGITAFSALPFLGSNPVLTDVESIFQQMGSFYTSLVTGSLFVGIVVPPLIFEAMMHIKTPDLRAVIRPSLVLATAGVIISTLVTGYVLYRIPGLPLSISLLFGAIIAPTDAVTVLEIFRRTAVAPRLATLMETEAAFNDATAIVVFTIVLSSITLAKISLVSAAFSFAYSILGGVLVGLVIALIARGISSKIDDKIAELILTISAVYGSYVFASGVGTSGLIAVAIVGLYFGNVTVEKTVGPQARDTILTFWEVAAFVGNSVAFLLIGFETNLVVFAQSIFLIVAAYLAVTVARAASVYPILGIFNVLGGKIPLRWCNIAMLGGVRGALSIALAATLTASAVLSADDIRTITSMVLGVAFISIVFQIPILSQYIERTPKISAEINNTQPKPS